MTAADMNGTDPGNKAGVGSLEDNLGRVGMLRGADVRVDPRVAGRVALSICFVGIFALAIALAVAGATKNGQISALRSRGVPVEIRVQNCIGLMGGSGSNVAGYACTGAFSLDGGRYVVAIPGDQLYPVGSNVRAVSVPSDPRLISTRAILAGERASWRVFIIPAVLFLLLAAIAAALLRRRSARSAVSGALRPART